MNETNQDIVRVLRILEYTGPRDAVEQQVSRSTHGEKTWDVRGKRITIRAATIGQYPEVLQTAQSVESSLCNCGHPHNAHGTGGCMVKVATAYPFFPIYCVCNAVREGTRENYDADLAHRLSAVPIVIPPSQPQVANPVPAPAPVPERYCDCGHPFTTHGKNGCHVRCIAFGVVEYCRCRDSHGRDTCDHIETETLSVAQSIGTHV